jgi:hypothetical protein
MRFSHAECCGVLDDQFYRGMQGYSMLLAGLDGDSCSWMDRTCTTLVKVGEGLVACKQRQQTIERSSSC